MKLIKPSVEILEQGPGMQGIYDMIEICGKTSYKSTVKGGEEAAKFVSARTNDGHFAVLEFGTVYLKVPPVLNHQKYEKNPYSKVKKYEGFYYVTTNYRVIIENGWEKDLQWRCEPTEYHAKRHTARIITNIGITRELCRHRSFSFCEQSTRYCNYNSGKFGEEITYVIPEWAHSLREGVLEYSPFEITPKEAELMQAWYDAEKRYKNMLVSQALPQEARDCLPLGTATEICVCGFEDAWQHFFELRCSPHAHPSMQEVANMAKEMFIQCKYITEDA